MKKFRLSFKSSNIRGHATWPLLGLMIMAMLLLAASAGATTYNLPGGSLTTSTGNGHGGSGTIYGVPFDVTPGDVTLYAYNVDMHLSRNNQTWGCSPYTPPLPAATAAAVIQFGATNLSAFTSDWPNPPNSAWENLLLKYDAGYYLGQQAYSNPGFVLGPSLGWNTPYLNPNANGGWHCTGDVNYDLFDLRLVYHDLGAGNGFRVTAYQLVHASTDPGSPANTWKQMYDAPGYQDVPEAAVNKLALQPFVFVANQGISGTPGSVTISWSSVQVEGTASVPTVVYVDDNYVGHSNGDIVDGHVFGYDAFATIPDGITAVATNGTVNVAAGAYAPGVQITRDVSVVGQGALLTRRTITPTGNTGDPGSGNARAWFLVASGVTANFSNINFDGTGYDVSIGILDFGGGTISNCGFSHIAWQGGGPGWYYGRAIASYGTTLPLTVEDCDFANIGRIGTFFFYANTGTKIYRRNSYTGKGSPGDWLDYGVELGGGAVATIENSTFTNCTGVATVDGSVSAAILASTYFGLGTAGVFNGNILTGNSYALAVGYGTGDATAASAYSNKMESIHEDVSSASSATVNASGNWWGQATEPTQFVLLSAPALVRPSSADGDAAPMRRALDADWEGSVDYTPWLNSNSDTSGNPGFQGDFSYLNVGAGGAQTGSVGRIQEGINMTVGSTVNVAAGLYHERFIVSSSVNLRGAQYGVDPTPTGARTNPADETVVDLVGQGVTNPNYLVKFTSGATNAAISGFTLNGSTVFNYADEATIRCDVNANYVSVQDNILDGYYTILYKGNDHVTAQRNRITGNKVGITVQPSPASYVVLSGNKLSPGLSPASDCKAIYMTGTSHSSVIGNTASDFSGSWGSGEGLAGSVHTDLNVSGNTFTSDKKGISLWGGVTFTTVSGNTISGCLFNGIEIKGSDLTITGNTITGNATGIYLDRHAINTERVKVKDNIITGNSSYGMIVTAAVTKVDSVTNNKFSNPAGINISDAVASNYYDVNCYSDFASNSGFPTQYNVMGGGGNADLNPNTNGCGNVDVYGPAYVGCGGGGCAGDMLYYTLDQDSMVNGRLWITLPAGFVADWTTDPHFLTAGAGWDPHFSMGWAQRLSGNKVEIDVFFDASAGGSSGNPALYIAAIPIKNASAGHCTHNVVAGDSAYFLQGPGNPPVRRDLFLASTTITVDCEAPVSTLVYNPPAPACNAYGNATQLLNAFKADILRGDMSCNAPLDSAWITVNGHSYTFFGDNPVDDFSQIFPGSGTISETTLWDWLNEGCNDIVLHYRDTECNESSATLSNIGKDTTIPVLTVGWSQPQCYNNESLSPQYGAGLIGTDLNIDANVGTGDCIAQTGEMWFRYGSNTYPSTHIALPVDDYPAAGAEASELWTWMVGQVPPGVSGNYTFYVHVKDCAQNETSQSFVVCIDLERPANTFAILDARPTGLGVWVKWAWTYDATNAVEAKIFRSEYVSDATYHYPGYNTPYFWDNFNADAEYEQNYYDASGNWILVATLSSLYQTSGAYPGTHDPSGSYWYDAGNWDTLGTDHEYRDIYRYVTFVKDVSGNWSQVATTYTQGMNADRSTNYWLGDFTMDTDDDMLGNASSGAVEGADLGMFTSAYFKAVPPAHARYDIGPETGWPGGENAVGKGIPMPDDTVNFYDLIPFSFNFYMTGYQTWVLPPPPNTPELDENLDSRPVVSVCRTNLGALESGDEFTVTIEVTGNGENVVKGVEALLTYNPEALEFVSATPGEVTLIDGMPFAVARPVEGCTNVIGAAAAACGPNATMCGDMTLATVTFRWKNDQGTAEIALAVIRMFDAYGNIVSGSGNVLSIGTGTVLPTEYALYQNYPNPFNPMTTFAFDLKKSGAVTLKVYNLLGQEVAIVVNQVMQAGHHQVKFEADRLASGLYIYKIEANEFRAVRKMMLMR